MVYIIPTVPDETKLIVMVYIVTTVSKKSLTMVQGTHLMQVCMLIHTHVYTHVYPNASMHMFTHTSTPMSIDMRLYTYSGAQYIHAHRAGTFDIRMPVQTSTGKRARAHPRAHLRAHLHTRLHACPMTT